MPPFERRHSQRIDHVDSMQSSSAVILTTLKTTHGIFLFSKLYHQSLPLCVDGAAAKFVPSSLLHPIRA
jgi:hypothetical protein